MKKTLLICATALLVASCSKDTTETPEVPEAKRQGIIFSAAQDNDVRTKLDGVNILWQRNDAVGIFSEQIPEAVNYKAVITEEDHDKQFATLHTDLSYNGNSEYTFYAYYPYVDGLTDAWTVNGSISTLQNGEIGSNAFMWATATAMADSVAMPRVDLHFEHPFTYLNIQLCATGAYRGATVERIRIEAPEGKTLAGNFEANMIYRDVFFTTNERAVEVDLTSQEDRPIATLGDDYLNTLMVVNAEDLTDSELTVIVTLRQNGQAVKLRTVKAGRRLKPQTKVNLKLAVEEMEAEQSDDVIMFADDAVKAICVERWDTNGDGSLSYKEAAEVQSLEWAFMENAGISSFDELQYFKGLTSIGGFINCSGLTSIVIPDNVTSIEDHAFYGCSSLTSIVIPDNVTSIGGSAFYGCSSLANITLSDNLTSIGEGAFENCSSLTSIVIPDKVTTLGSRAFYDCVKLTDVTIGNGIEAIPEYCFSSLSSLANVTLPDNLTSIGERAFENCSGLTSIVIPDNVTSIEGHAFYGCSSLTSIVIPDNLTSIGEGAFENCSSLKSIAIPDKVTTLGNSAFSGCSSLTSIVIPEKVTSIGDSAFYGCESLTSIVIPDKVTTLRRSASNDCNRLANIALPNNLTSIGNYAFYGCKSLTSIVIPDKVWRLGNNAFVGCVRLTDVTIGKGIETIPDYCFSSCSSLENIVIPNNVTSIGSYAFASCGNLVDIVIPENVTSIGSSAFMYCTGLESVTLPDKISEIGEGVFHQCFSLKTFNGKYASKDHRCLIRNGELIAFAPASLKEYVIPESVTSFGYGVFTDCTELESITISDGITEIIYYAFEDCTGIKSVTISKNVTLIGDCAFSDCPLTEVYCRALTPPTCEYSAFKNMTNMILYVPTESVELYRAKATWKNFGQIIGYNFGNL